MPTLAPKLPWTHPFAGGYPRLGGQSLPTDPDAIDYLSRVAAADGAAVEVGVAMAVDAFVKGCKADGIWSALKASCIMCGARTIGGALVPLVGAAPTNVADGFVSGDYTRGGATPGLQGDGTSYLDTGRANDDDPQDDHHMSLWCSVVTTGSAMGAGGTETGTTRLGRRNPPGFTNTLVFRSRTNAGVTDKTDAQWLSGFAGITRDTSSSYTARSAGTDLAVSETSQAPYAQNVYVFTRNVAGVPNDFAGSGIKIAFYSVGESLDLALLDARVTTLVTAIGAAV